MTFAKDLNNEVNRQLGIRITGLRDASNGPTCGDCAGHLMTKQYPPDGYQCPMCRRIWFRHGAGALARHHKAVLRHLAKKVKCTLCGEHWLEGEGHACPKIPAPRRREAILATRRKM